jgi:hypothetical protein
LEIVTMLPPSCHSGCAVGSVSDAQHARELASMRSEQAMLALHPRAAELQRTERCWTADCVFCRSGDCGCGMRRNYSPDPVLRCTRPSVLSFIMWPWICGRVRLLSET